MSTALVLCDVHLDDTRPNREGKITRFMERREQESSGNLIDVAGPSGKMRSMIDVTFRMKENDMFGKFKENIFHNIRNQFSFRGPAADVKVFSFNLILSMDFLMKLSSFLQPEGGNASSTPAEIEAKEVEVARRRKSSVSGVQAAQQAEKTITLALHIEEYDVILVEKMDDINCLALILNVSFADEVLHIKINFCFPQNRMKSQQKFVCMEKSNLSRARSKTLVYISASLIHSDVTKRNITCSIHAPSV